MKHINIKADIINNFQLTRRAAVVLSRKECQVSSFPRCFIIFHGYLRRRDSCLLFPCQSLIIDINKCDWFHGNRAESYNESPPAFSVLWNIDVSPLVLLAH